MMAGGYICPRDYIPKLEQRVCHAITRVASVSFLRIGILQQPNLQNSSPGCDTPAPFKKNFKDIYNRQISRPVNRRPGTSAQTVLNGIV